MNINSVYKNHIKRILDFIIASVALIVLSPVLLCISILIRIKLGSPIFFKQARPGKNERIFQLFKFRSMTNATGEDGRLLPDAERLTKFGKFLRASSLDELPELINIIIGDMSLVGPRPLSIYYLPHYSTKFRRRHEVKPGLTGLAQINGRNNIQWNDRFSLDINYVETLSFILDLKIILTTVLKVLKRSDVTVRGTNKVKDYSTYCVLQEERQKGNRVKGMATYSEIGSYFWLDNEPLVKETTAVSWLPQVSDSCFTFSGRNAIDIALRDVLHNRHINTVYVPSYSCISMLQAFIDRDMKIEFYNVGFESGRFTYQLPEVGKGSLVLIMSYFGLNASDVHDKIIKLHNKGAVVIEDVTHSLLRKDAFSLDSDYVVVSLRKWFAIPTGGWVGKKNGSLAEKTLMDSNPAVKDKIAAMHEKYAYLTGSISTKDYFLEANATFENDLIHVDRMLKIDDLSLNILKNTDIKKVINQRRLNAKALLNGLADLDGKICKIPKIDLTSDVPLFVPIFLDTEQRDSLRTYLIDKGVYCPVHWPEVAGAPSELKERELSLICDQRYSEADMHEIVDCIYSWAKSNQN